MKKLIKRIPIQKKIATIIFVGLLAALAVLFIMQKNENAEVKNIQQQSTENIPAEKVPVKSDDLESCLKRANNSEAHQGIIDERIRDCYEIYR